MRIMCGRKIWTMIPTKEILSVSTTMIFTILRRNIPTPTATKSINSILSHTPNCLGRWALTFECKPTRRNPIAPIPMSPELMVMELARGRSVAIQKLDIGCKLASAQAERTLTAEEISFARTTPILRLTSGRQDHFTWENGSRLSKVEVFNLFNNKNNINTISGSGTPLFDFDGFIRQGVGDPREAQLSIRLQF